MTLSVCFSNIMPRLQITRATAMLTHDLLVTQDPGSTLLFIQVHRLFFRQLLWQRHPSTQRRKTVGQHGCQHLWEMQMKSVMLALCAVSQ